MSTLPSLPPAPRRSASALFLQLVFVYVALLCLAHGFESGLVKLLSGVFAFWVFGVMAVNAAFLASAAPRDRRALGLSLLLPLLLYLLAMAASLAVNRGRMDMQEWAKFVLAPLFLVFGHVCAARETSPAWQSGFNRGLFRLLVLLPVGVWLVQLALERTVIGGNQVVGPFVNRNNAALYYLCLIALYTSLSGRQVSQVWVYLVVGLAFGTLGVLLAVVVSLLYAVGQRRNLGQLALLAVLGTALVIVLPDSFLSARIGPVLDSYRLLADQRIDLRTISYGELVARLGTTDLSFIFRLKHWTDLLDLYLHGSVFQQLFGFGIGASQQLSQMRLVPHNDYVRLLFEGGAFAFLGFATLLLVALRRLGRRWEAVPFVAVCVYFFSENLLNNHVAMIVFFFSLGALLQRRQTPAAGGA